MIRPITITIIIVSIYLSSCSPSQTVIPSETPTIIATEPFLPTLTNSPTITPTTDPGSLQSIQSEAGALCSNIFMDYEGLEFGFDPTRWGWGFDPNTAAFINVEYENSDWELAELYSSAPTVDQVNSIVCIRQSRINQGTYTSGGIGYQPEWDVWLVKWPEGTLLGNRIITGGNPPSTITGSGTHYGKLPEEDLINWLADLEREPFYIADHDITHLAFSADGETLIVSTRTSISLVQAAGGEVAQTIQIPEGSWWDDVYSPDHTRVAVSLCLSNEVGLSGHHYCLQSEMRVIDIRNGNTLLTMRGETPYSYALAISPDGKTLATQSTDTTISGSSKSVIHLWDIASGRSILEIPDIHAYTSWLFFTPDGSAFIHDSGDYVNYHVRDITSGEILNQYHQYLGTIQEFSPLSNTLAHSSSGGCIERDCPQRSVYIFDFQTGTTLQEIPLGSSEIYAIAFSPDGTQLAVSSCAQMQFLNIEQELYPKCVAGMVTILDLATNRILRTLYPSTSVIYGLAYSPDQSSLVTGDLEGNVKIWELTSE